MTEQLSRTGGRNQRWPQPQTSSAFADAATFLERIGAAGFCDEAEEDKEGGEELDDEASEGWRQRRRQRRQRRPSESLGRRLRNFLMRPRRRRQSASEAAAAAAMTAEAEVASSSELQDYVYTRWVFHGRWYGSPERSLSHDHLRCAAAAGSASAHGVPEVAASAIGVDTGVQNTTATAAAVAAPAGRRSTKGGSAMTKSASARMVRFRCPYDSSGSDQDSTLVSPYLTSAFPCLPLPPGGSVSSGYSSDRDTPLEAAAATASTASQHWVTREEDIDCLLLRRPALAAGASAASAVQVGDEDDDFDLAKLDVSAFFASPSDGLAASSVAMRRRDGEYRTLPLPPPPPLPPRCHRNSQNLTDGDQRGGAISVYYDPVADEIDRLVGEVVRLGGSSWRRQQRRP